MNQLLLRSSSPGPKRGSTILQRFLKKKPTEPLATTMAKSLKDVRSLSTASSTASLTESEESMSMMIPRWNVPMMESKGDYRGEIALEEHIGGNLYMNQSSLPRLPIPAVTDTIEKLMPTAMPLAKTQAELDAFQSACQHFPSQAEKLQKRLIERREVDQKDSSWLQPWWNELGYLQVRDSVVIGVSYWFAFVDDRTLCSSSPIPPNVQRAATMCYAAAEFRKSVVSGMIDPELLGRQKIPLDSTAYRYMFNATRIPDQEHDSYRIYDPSRHDHVIVARKGQFFSVVLVDDMGDPLPMNVLQNQLLECIKMADKVANPDSVPKIGILSGTNRTSWANNRDKLLSIGGTAMADALTELESGAFLINLDDTEPQTIDEQSDMLMTGGKVSSDNRWFDKSIQMIVAENGKAGWLCEHSLMDGMPVTRFCDYVTKATYGDMMEKSAKLDEGRQTPVVRPPLNIFQQPMSQIDHATLKSMEEEARAEFNANLDKQSSNALVFDGYGSDYIKSCGHPPDALAQVAIQLATYRLFGEQVGTYEATQVRKFLHGRTEVTRAVTTESAAFLARMGLDVGAGGTTSTDRNEQRTLLQNATMAHQKFSKQASEALGVDRHLFGLQMLVKDNEEPPALFSDPVFNRSKRWRVSTSNLSHPMICNWGFGQVVPDGVGVGYSIQKKSLVFNLAALEETGWAPQLKNLLHDVLNEDMPPLLQNELPKSKL